jgi:hypothetical protein
MADTSRNSSIIAADQTVEAQFGVEKTYPGAAHFGVDQTHPEVA